MALYRYMRPGADLKASKARSLTEIELFGADAARVSAKFTREDWLARGQSRSSKKPPSNQWLVNAKAMWPGVCFLLLSSLF